MIVTSTTTGSYTRHVPSEEFRDQDRCCRGRDTKTFSFTTVEETKCVYIVILRTSGDRPRDIQMYPLRQTLSYIIFERLDDILAIVSFNLQCLTSPLNLLVFYKFNEAFKKKFLELFRLGHVV